MTMPPPEPHRANDRRNWTVGLVVTAVAIAFLLMVCLIGFSVAYFAYNRSKADRAVPTPAASKVEIRPSQPAKAPEDCLLGDWHELTAASNSDIFGTSVQLTGGGAVTRFSADGKVTVVLKDVVMKGSAGGDSYEVVHQGTLQMSYLADAKTIRYSNPVADGTTTWKINGKVEAREQMRASLKEETYSCSGNLLKIFGDGSSSENERLVGPGVVT